MLPLLKHSHLTLFRPFNPIINVMALIIIDYWHLPLINQLYGGLHPIWFPCFEKFCLLITLLEWLASTVTEHYHGISFCWSRGRVFRLLHHMTLLSRVLIHRLVHLVTLNVEVSRRITRIKDRNSFGGKFSFLKVSENRTNLWISL